MKTIILSVAALFFTAAPALAEMRCAGEGVTRKCWDTSNKEMSYGSTAGQSYNRNDPNLDRNRKPTPLYNNPGSLNKIPMQ